MSSLIHIITLRKWMDHHDTHSGERTMLIAHQMGRLPPHSELNIRQKRPDDRRHSDYSDPSRYCLRVSRRSLPPDSLTRGAARFSRRGAFVADRQTHWSKYRRYRHQERYCIAEKFCLVFSPWSQSTIITIVFSCSVSKLWLHTKFSRIERWQSCSKICQSYSSSAAKWWKLHIK